MEPIKFKESNKTLLKPEGVSDAECGSLPVHVADGTLVSCWKPTIRERLSILFFGRVWLWVWSGETQPPVALDGKKTIFKYEVKNDRYDSNDQFPG